MAGDHESALTAKAKAFATEAIRANLRGDPAQADAMLGHAAGTADTLAEIGADEAAQAAAWLFGADRIIPVAEVAARFGDDVGQLVDSMRKLRRLQELHRDQAAPRRDRDQAQRAEVLRRMLLALSVDARVVLLRLASRLETLRSAARLSAPPSMAICHETLDLLAPLANRLGIAQLKWPLEDLAFRFIAPQRYQEIASALKETRRDREAAIDRALESLRMVIGPHVGSATIVGRAKHIYSIHKKMVSKELRFEELQDLLAARVMVETQDQCYDVLARIHAHWTPVPGEFDDYIVSPKPNGYQSLHTVVWLDERHRLEVQVRTHAMHEAAEFGGASHWRYKEGTASNSAEREFDDRIAWVRQLLQWQSEVGEALGVGSQASASDEPVYALTPEAKIVVLPAGATPVDFAYRVHTELGHGCRGARIDGKLVPLNTPLQTGQTVEIIGARRAEAARPSRDWLRADAGILISHRARQKVRQWFAKEDSEREQAEGRSQMERLLARVAVSNVGHDILAARLGYGTSAGLYSAVARAEVGPRALERAARGDMATQAPQAGEGNLVRRVRSGASDNDRGILIAGVDALLHHLAKCCHPVPPEPIAGYVTAGRGVTIHRLHCRVLVALQARASERIIPAAWPQDTAGVFSKSDGRFEMRVTVRAGHRENLVSDFGEILAREKIPILRSRQRRLGDEAVLEMTLAVQDIPQSEAALRKIGQIPGVSAVRRD